MGVRRLQVHSGFLTLLAGMVVGLPAKKAAAARGLFRPATADEIKGAEKLIKSGEVAGLVTSPFQCKVGEQVVLIKGSLEGDQRNRVKVIEGDPFSSGKPSPAPQLPQEKVWGELLKKQMPSLSVKP